MFIMLGYDGERIEDLQATVDHLKHTAPDVFLTTVSYPIKGTPYYDQVADRLAPQSWADAPIAISWCAAVRCAPTTTSRVAG